MTSSGTISQGEQQPAQPAKAGIEPTDVSWLDGLRAGVWFGVLAGVIELLILGVLKFGSLAPPIGRLTLGWDPTWRHSYLWLSQHIVWIAPLVLAAALGGAGMVGVAVGRVVPRISVTRSVVGVVAFLAAVNTLYVYPRLYNWAVVILSLGIAAQVVRTVSKRQPRFWVVIRRTTPWLAGGVVVTSVGMLGGFALAERLARGRLPSPVPAAPNVLVLILDTVRAASVSVYDSTLETTPHLEELAREGVVFDRAIATAPWTLPSHVSILTGFLPYQSTGSWLAPWRGEHLTVTERLAKRGYVTGGFVANVVYNGYESGIDKGFLHYEDYALTPSEFLLSTALGRKVGNAGLVRRAVGFHDVLNRKTAEDVTNDFLRWLDDRGDRPFFGFLNYLDAHEPYLPPAPFDSMFGSPEVRRPELNQHQLRLSVRLGRAEMTAAEQAAELGAYHGAIAYIDQQLGRIVDALTAQGILDNTILIVTSDHGEHFGEHDLYLHGNSLYLPALHVPFLIRFGDRIPQGVRVDAPVSIRDIPATVMDLIGDTQARFPGVSLRTFWSRGPMADLPRPIVSELTDIRGAPTWKSIVLGRYHYIWHESGLDELYDTADDPDEQINLARDPTARDRLTAMRRVLAPFVRNDLELWQRLPQRQGTAPPARPDSTVRP